MKKTKAIEVRFTGVSPHRDELLAEAKTLLLDVASSGLNWTHLEVVKAGERLLADVSELFLTSMDPRRDRFAHRLGLLIHLFAHVADAGERQSSRLEHLEQLTKRQAEVIAEQDRSINEHVGLVSENDRLLRQLRERGGELAATAKELAAVNRSLFSEKAELKKLRTAVRRLGEVFNSIKPKKK